MNSKNDSNKNILHMEKGIIKNHRKYKTLKNEISALNYSISFQRDYLMGMINNLSYMNNIKLNLNKIPAIYNLLFSKGSE